MNSPHIVRPHKDRRESVQAYILGINLKSFDIYMKLDEEYKIKTSGGAVFSIIGWILITILCLGEFKNYMTPVVKEHMTVDKTLGEKLKININITYHALTCAQVHVDAMDVAGDNQVDIDQQIYKQRISAKGLFIGDKSSDGVGNNILKPLPSNYCGSCYGAETEYRKCCNTCNDVKQAYDDMNWNRINIITTAEQCQREHTQPLYASEAGESCQVSGTLIVNKVSGNFHVAHGESIIRDGRHIHQFNPAEAPSYNISHTIHTLSFGDTYPHMLPNPLDGIKRITTTDTGLFQYYIKLIPVTYTDYFGRKIHTNEYTVSEKFRPFTYTKDPQGGIIPLNTVLPGMFVVYDLSPFMKEIKKEYIPYTHYLTRICAIIGGVYTIMAVIDGVLYRIQTMIKKNKK